MNQALINFRDNNIPIGIDPNDAYKDMIKYIYLQHFKYNTPIKILADNRTHWASVSGFTGSFLREFIYGR